MKTKRSKLIMLTIVGALLTATTATAAISPTNDTFQTNTESFPGWSVVLTSTNTVLLWDAALYDYVVDGGMTNITGDGLLNDHGLRMDTKNAVIKDEAIGFTLSGTMDEGETVTFSGNAYNDNSSSAYLYAQIWNFSDDALLAESAKITVLGNATPAPQDFSIAYTATAADAGDTVQIRFLEEANSTARDIYIDNFSVTSVPETLYAYEGFDTANSIGSNADAAGVTGSGFTSYTNTDYLMDLEAGLSYSDSSGNALLTTGKSAGMDEVGGGTQNLQLALDSTISSGTIYMSFLTDVTAFDEWNYSIGLLNDVTGGDSTGIDANMSMGIRSSASTWRIHAASTQFAEGGTVSTGVHFVVASANIDTGDVTFWLDPTDLTDISGTAAATITGNPGGALAAVNGFAFSLGGDEAGTIDEIRIGNTLNVVVPLEVAVAPVLYAYEGFDRPLNNRIIYSTLTGSGFTAITNSNYRFIYTAGLSYTDGNSNTLLSVGNASGINPAVGGTQNMQLSFPEITSGKLYVSFITDVLSVIEWGVTLGLQDSQVDGSASVSPNSTLEAGIRSTSSANDGWGLYNANGLDERYTTGPLGLSFIVMEVDIDNDSVTAWINPTDLTDVPGTSTELTDGSDPYTIGAVSSFLFSLAGEEAGMVDEIRIGNTIAAVTPLSSGISLYDDWAEANGVGGSTENDDGDAQNNGIEYVLGSNPNDSEDTGSFEGRLDLDASGYIFPARNDDSVDVKVLSTTNLVSDNWTTNTYNASNNDGGIGLQTNMISLSEAQLFIKALVE